jgi:hypothetical protein
MAYIQQQVIFIFTYLDFVQNEPNNTLISRPSRKASMSLGQVFVNRTSGS